MKEIKTEIIINATLKAVWKKFIDFENYHKWNPAITSIKGEIKEGQKINVILGKEGRKFKPTIVKRVENKELSLRGKLVFKFLYDMEHKFELYDNNDGTTRFVQSVKINGILSSRINSEKLSYGFDEMNKALKIITEENQTLTYGILE